jgi:hypothetical protein
VPIDRQSVASPLKPNHQSFSLESEIRLSGMGVWSTVLGLFVMLILKLTLSSPRTRVPSLEGLVAIALVLAIFYYGIRVTTFSFSRLQARKKYPGNPPRIIPLQGGELPRNWFLISALVAPASLIPLCCVLLAVGIGLGPNMWIVISVGAALSLRDLTGAAHVLFVDPSRWIREAPSRLEVLSPTGDLCT